MDSMCFYFREWNSESNSMDYFSMKDTKYVSQCVNIVDKNRVPVFENDIINTSVGPLLVRYCPECKQFQGMYVNEKGNFECLACTGDLHWDEIIEDNEKIEVLGNIYETPNYKEKWFD